MEPIFLCNILFIENFNALLHVAQLFGQCLRLLLPCRRPHQPAQQPNNASMNWSLISVLLSSNIFPERLHRGIQYCSMNATSGGVDAARNTSTIFSICHSFISFFPRPAATVVDDVHGVLCKSIQVVVKAFTHRLLRRDQRIPAPVCSAPPVACPGHL